ncbi:MAG: ASCH domain-containing protein [Vicinamibacterales bacterium]
MKALTVCQPYAELIARGDKPIENRTWPTSYRGPLAIHAGKSRAWLGADDEDAALYAVDVRAIPFGAVVAIADLVACLPLLYPADGANWPARWKALANHEHANGPYCWVLENVRRIEPAPYRGAQGIWEWSR